MWSRCLSDRISFFFFSNKKKKCVWRKKARGEGWTWRWVSRASSHQQEGMGCGWQNHWVFLFQIFIQGKCKRCVFVTNHTASPFVFSCFDFIFFKKHVLETWARQWLRTMMYTSSSTDVVQSLQAKAPNLVLSDLLIGSR